MKKVMFEWWLEHIALVAMVHLVKELVIIIDLMV